MNVSQSRRLTATIVLLSLGCFLAPQARAIRYELIDQGAGAQNGHTLSGFIEFDTPCGGSCTGANIVDFSFTVSGPTNYAYARESTNDVFFYQYPGFAFLDAGPRFLSVDYAGYGRLYLHKAITNQTILDNPFLAWDAIPPNIQHPYPDGLALYRSKGLGSLGGWETNPAFAQQVAIGIAIPEPSTWLLLTTSVLLVASGHEYK